VYVALGTAPLFNQPEKFAPLLAGLAGEAAEIVVTVGESNDPAAFGELPPTVHIETWLPLSPLLPRCDAVLCHGGTGTTLAALAAGLPLVLVPQGADQFDNARACERAGAARILMPDQVTPAAVRNAVRSARGRFVRATICRRIIEMISSRSGSPCSRSSAVASRAVPRQRSLHRSAVLHHAICVGDDSVMPVARVRRAADERSCPMRAPRPRGAHFGEQ
jgi:UDP:flavonoid glycosyltransferase YjiC (YdhE family)